MFDTARLRLRGFETSNTRFIFNLWNNPQVLPSITNEYIVPTGPKFMEKIPDIAQQTVMFLVIHGGPSEGGAMIGTTSIEMTHPKNRDGLFSIMLEPEFWGRGYGEEVTRFVVDYCFRSLGLHRVSLQVFEGSERALSLYKKIGFVEEGRKRKVNWIDGHWEDLVNMGILEEEWQKSGQK